MADAILVLNAGSSSLKFSAFSRGRRAGAVLRGEAEGLIPRLASRRRTRRAGRLERSWEEGGRSATTGLSPTWRLPARPPRRPRTDRRRPPRRAWRRGVAADRVDARGARALDELDPARAPAPAAQPRSPSRSIARMAGAAAGGVLRHRLSSRPARVAQAFALPERDHRRGVRRYGFHGLSYEYIASALPRIRRPARATGAHGRRASRQRREHVRDGGGRSVASTMGFTARRRPADGHAFRQLRSRRAALSDGRAGHGRARDREPDLQESGLLGVSGVSSDMRDAARERRSRAVSRSTSSLTASVASSARWRRRSAASMRWCSPPASASTRRPCASGWSRTPPGSASP